MKLDFDRLCVLCGTLVVIVSIGVMYSDCERQSDRALECVKSGHSPVECKAAFHVQSGGER